MSPVLLAKLAWAALGVVAIAVLTGIVSSLLATDIGNARWRNSWSAKFFILSGLVAIAFAVAFVVEVSNANDKLLANGRSLADAPVPNPTDPPDAVPRLPELPVGKSNPAQVPSITPPDPTPSDSEPPNRDTKPETKTDGPKAEGDRPARAAQPEKTDDEENPVAGRHLDGVPPLSTDHSGTVARGELDPAGYSNNVPENDLRHVAGENLTPSGTSASVLPPPQPNAGGRKNEIADLPRTWRLVPGDQIYRFEFVQDRLYIFRGGSIVADLALKREKSGAARYYEGTTSQSSCPSGQGGIQVTKWGPSRIEGRLEEVRGSPQPFCGGLKDAFRGDTINIVSLFGRRWTKVNFIPESR